MADKLVYNDGKTKGRGYAVETGERVRDAGVANINAGGRPLKKGPANR